MKLFSILILFCFISCKEKVTQITKNETKQQLKINKEYNVELQKLLINNHLDIADYEKIIIEYTAIKTLLKTRNPLYKSNLTSFKNFVSRMDPLGLFVSQQDFDRIFLKTHLLEKNGEHMPILFISSVNDLIKQRTIQFKKNTTLFLENYSFINPKVSFYIGKNKPLAINELNLIQNFDAYLQVLSAQIIYENSSLSTKDQEFKKLISEHIDSMLKNVTQNTLSKLCTLYFNAMLESTDQFSQYISSEDLAFFQKNMQVGTFQFGIEWKQELNGLLILKVLTNSAAESAGIKRGDIIIKVKTESIEFNTTNFTDSLRFLKLNTGSEATFTIKRGKTILTKAITPSLNSTDKDFSYKVIEKEFGYLKIPYFYYNKKQEDKLSAKIEKLIPELNKTKHLIIDLRDNPGGQLNEALELLSFFIPKTPLFIEKNKTQESVIFSEQKANFFKGKVAIIVNSNSGSASELFASAMQENKKALIIGAVSAGKGTIQDLIDLNQFSSVSKKLGQIKLTRSTFHKLSGEPVSNRGITPDIPLVYDSIKTTALDKIIVPKAKAVLINKKNPQVNLLKKLSIERQTLTLSQLIDSSNKINTLLKNNEWLISDVTLLTQINNSLDRLNKERDLLINKHGNLDVGVIETIQILKDWHD